MCTAISLKSKSKEIFLGRTMDFSYDIMPKLYAMPESYIWNGSFNKTQIKDSYRFIGLGQEMDGILSFFDGVNEKGFAAAVLYFAGYAKYNTESAYNKSEQIAAFDFLHYMLGSCSSVKDLPLLIKNISILGIEDPLTNTVAPLHWIAADKTGACAVIESTQRGLEIFNNPIGVMANSPDFNWHMTNLRNYMEVSPIQSEEAFWESVRLTPFGQAGGTVALPGGFTSPERFVRAAYLKSHLPELKDSNEAIISGFHVLESVTIPKGAVISSRNTYDYTKYTAMINISTCEYFFKFYDDLCVRISGLWLK